MYAVRNGPHRWRRPFRIGDSLLLGTGRNSLHDYRKANRLGGLIKTDRIQGCELEAGPDSFHRYEDRRG